jgi:hypothetical protein
MIVLKRVSVETRQHVAGESTVSHPTLGVDGVLSPDETWLVGVVDVDLACLHVDPADTLSNEQSEVDIAVTLGSDYGGKLSRLGQMYSLIFSVFGSKTKVLLAPISARYTLSSEATISPKGKESGVGIL